MKSAIRLLADQLASWAPLEDLPEVNWKSAMRSLDFQEVLGERNELALRLPSFMCQSCSDFDDHVSGVCHNVRGTVLTSYSTPQSI